MSSSRPLRQPGGGRRPPYMPARKPASKMAWRLLTTTPAPPKVPRTRTWLAGGFVFGLPLPYFRPRWNRPCSDLATPWRELAFPVPTRCSALPCSHLRVRRLPSSSESLTECTISDGCPIVPYHRLLSGPTIPTPGTRYIVVGCNHGGGRGSRTPVRLRLGPSCLVRRFVHGSPRRGGQWRYWSFRCAMARARAVDTLEPPLRFLPAGALSCSLASVRGLAYSLPHRSRGHRGSDFARPSKTALPAEIRLVRSPRARPVPGHPPSSRMLQV